MIIRYICRVTRPLTTHSNTVYNKSDAFMQSTNGIFYIFIKTPSKIYAHCNCLVLDYFIFNQYKIIILRTFNRPVQHNHLTIPFNITIQQTHST